MQPAAAQPGSSFRFGQGFSAQQQQAITPQVTPGQFTFGKGAPIAVQQAERQETPGSGVRFSFGAAQRKKPAKPSVAASAAAEQAGEEEEMVSVVMVMIWPICRLSV